MMTQEQVLMRRALYDALCFLRDLAGSSWQEEKVQEAYSHYKSYKELSSGPAWEYPRFEGNVVGAFMRNRRREQMKEEGTMRPDLAPAPIDVSTFMKDTLGIDVSGMPDEPEA